MRRYPTCVNSQHPEILLEDEPRFAGGVEISLAYCHLSLVFDKLTCTYSLSCDDEDGEAVRLILEPLELRQIVARFLAAILTVQIETRNHIAGAGVAPVRPDKWQVDAPC
jgi:hypothetical protein